MSFNHHDISRDACMLHGPLRSHGYDWWWHSFTAQDAVTGEDKPFFVEFFLCNPALGGDAPVLGQLRYLEFGAGSLSVRQRKEIWKKQNLI